MKRILVLLAVMTIASVVAAACGDDGDPGPSPVSGVGPGISIGEASIGEALTSNLTGPLVINGFLHVQHDQARLCEGLVGSLPPLCAGRFLVVLGLDLTTIGGLTSEASVTWSDQSVWVLGTVEGEVLTVVARPLR